MRKFALASLLLFAVAQIAIAEESQEVSYKDIPLPTGVESLDPQIENLTWHRRTTKNFVILSLDDSQGEFLQRNIENMKQWVFTRWGLQNIDFPQRAYKDGVTDPGCMVVCVPNKELMKKLFRLEHSHGEVRKDDRGKIKKSVLWLLLEGQPAETIPPALTLVCLKEMEEKYGVQLGHWAHRGLAVMNGTLPQIRGKLGTLSQQVSDDRQIFFSKALLTMTEKEWRDKEVAHRDLYDSEAAALVLLFRKEFGEANFIKFLMNKNMNAAFGFRDYDQLDSTFKRYLFNLSADIAANRTPDNYLQIEAAKRQ